MRPSRAEKDVLDLVLREMRRAKRRKQHQLEHLIEPWLSSDGFYVWVWKGQPIDVYECAAVLPSGTARRTRQPREGRPPPLRRSK